LIGSRDLTNDCCAIDMKAQYFTTLAFHIPIALNMANVMFKASVSSP
jgi:hypothetical protein